MPLFVHQYTNREHCREIRNAQRKRYYSKTLNISQGRRRWTKEEDNLVLNSSLTDTELSKLIQRSVRSIQVRRCRLKK